MAKKKNSVEGGFLKRFRRGKAESEVFVPLTIGFLKLEYDPVGLLSRVSLVATDSSHARTIGKILYLRLDGFEEATLMDGVNSIGGQQWSGGHVNPGCTLEAEGTGPRSYGGPKISLLQWVDQCVAEIANPPGEALSKMTKTYDVCAYVNEVRSGNKAARERMWKDCSPRTVEETEVVLDLLTGAVENENGDLIFACVDPLKRASNGISNILQTVRQLLKSTKLGEFDRSEIQEILDVHTDSPE